MLGTFKSHFLIFKLNNTYFVNSLYSKEHKYSDLRLKIEFLENKNINLYLADRNV